MAMRKAMPEIRKTTATVSPMSRMHSRWIVVKASTPTATALETLRTPMMTTTVSKILRIPASARSTVQPHVRY
jgi:hypothetical protein